MSYYPSDPIFLTQGEPLSLMNVLYRTRVARILADADNQVAAVIQRQRLKVVNAIEQAVIDGYVTTYTLSANQASILARLRLSYTNRLEMGYLVTILGGLSILPLTVDFSALANGPLPAVFTGATWAIASGKAVNTPTLGAELLTDPGLEAAYSSGRCTTLTVGGSPTLAQSADAHGGTKAQEFTAVAFNNRLNWAAAAAVARQWYQYSIWNKRTAGSASTVRARIDISNALPTASQPMALIDAAYAQRKTAILATDTSNMFRYAAIETGSSSFETVVVDDGSYKALTFSSLFALITATQADVIMKCVPQTPMTDDSQVGLIARADTQSSPTHFILALLQRHPTITTSATVYLMKKVGNTYTVIANTGITLASGAYLELRCAGSTIKVYYNNAQVGTDQTVSDTEIVSNLYHGLFSTGDNNLLNFTLASN